MATLAEIRAKLQQIESRKGGRSQNNEDGELTYRFWNLSEGSSSTLRFLPDKNPDNTFFWQERLLINLTFPGIKGHDETKATTIRVPCMEMFGEPCPVLTEVRPWFNDSSLESTARKYWKKRSYMFQGFVVEDGLKEENTPENPIRKFSISPQIFNIIKAALMDTDMDHIPTSYENGTNFIITRTQKGGFNDYTTSKYSRKETALTDEQLAAIEKFGLNDLSTWLPNKPGPDGVNAIFEMFEASVAGELYDPERWGQHFRPYGLEVEAKPTAATTKPAEAAPAPKAEEAAPAAAEPVAEEAKASDPEPKASSAQDILAKIRARSAQ